MSIKIRGPALIITNKIMSYMHLIYIKYILQDTVCISVQVNGAEILCPIDPFQQSAIEALSTISNPYFT